MCELHFALFIAGVKTRFFGLLNPTHQNGIGCCLGESLTRWCLQISLCWLTCEQWLFHLIQNHSCFTAALSSSFFGFHILWISVLDMLKLCGRRIIFTAFVPCIKIKCLDPCLKDPYQVLLPQKWLAFRWQETCSCFQPDCYSWGKV